MFFSVSPSSQAFRSDGGRVTATAAAPPATLTSSVQQSLLQGYAHARQKYKQAHAQYSARVPATGPSPFEQYCVSAFQDMFFYTSATDPAACCAASRCTHGSHKASLHEVNYQLRLRARDRLRSAAASASSKRHCTGDGVFALLVKQEAAELADILEMEAEAFRNLAYAYYNHVYGPANQIIAAEAQARRQLEDTWNEATARLLEAIREETWRAEQRIMLRVYGVCPELLPHQSQVRAAADAAKAEKQKLIAKDELDCKDAVPLWHRACVIRGETESEEDISFRRLMLACLVQAHAIEEGYLSRNSVTGCLGLTGKAVPVYMRDAVEYGLQFEQFAFVLKEETERMALVDAAEVVPSAQFTQCFF